MYQLTIGKTQLQFDTKEEGLTALLSKWYHDRFPYRWREDGKNLIIADDWIGDYISRCKKLLPKLEADLTETGVTSLDAIKLEALN